MRRAAALGLVAVLLACEGAYLTAPPETTITLFATPNSIPSHGGVSELTAVLTEAPGTDVPDGTVVIWSTTLGRVDRETRTTRGIAHNRLVSDSRSGTAVVVASSGGGAIPVPAPSGSPSASPSPGTTPTTRPSSGGGANSAQVTVLIGNALVETVTLRAVPSRITNSNSTHVIATVLDAAGNPVPNVPVFFEVFQNPDFDFFDFSGPIHTNNNGEAEAVLRTRRTVQGTIVVRARAAGPGGFQDSPDLTIPVL